ncbi:hypothetical protein QKW60_00510 [Defluviimonas aestuarii]|uniref:Flp family type IVb pilin n=1 Tax=Albidovulum aestuarii TaxID=1130726 RepID=UPI00249C05FE|nr:hypothetical protein [Defluviimonas aestuarii]MDI3334882.1 hypothetical protein [Defluviimonas aestuarii]
MRSTLMMKLRSFRTDEEGVTLVEYGIALTLAIIVGVSALTNLGTNVSDEMVDACTVLNNSGTTNTTAC